MENRVLVRHGARELTADELSHVNGGIVHTTVITGGAGPGPWDLAETAD